MKDVKRDTRIGMLMCVLGGLFLALGFAIDTTWSLAFCGFGGALGGSGAYRVFRARRAMHAIDESQQWEKWRHR